MDPGSMPGECTSFNFPLTLLEKSAKYAKILGLGQNQIFPCKISHVHQRDTFTLALGQRKYKICNNLGLSQNKILT